MNNKIIIINGPNINLLGEREQSQYGSTTYDQLKENCSKKAKEIGLDVQFAQSNVEGELVNIIQDARKKFDGMIINAAAFTHTSVAIRDALDIFKKPIIELHISNIYKREEFRKKSLISLSILKSLGICFTFPFNLIFIFFIFFIVYKS